MPGARSVSRPGGPHQEILIKTTIEGPSSSHSYPPRETITPSTGPVEAPSSPQITQLQTDGPGPPSPSPLLRRTGKGLLAGQESEWLSRGRSHPSACHWKWRSYPVCLPAPSQPWVLDELQFLFEQPTDRLHGCLPACQAQIFNQIVCDLETGT